MAKAASRETIARLHQALREAALTNANLNNYITELKDDRDALLSELQVIHSTMQIPHFCFKGDLLCHITISGANGTFHSTDVTNEYLIRAARFPEEMMVKVISNQSHALARAYLETEKGEGIMQWCDETKSKYPEMFKKCFDFEIGEGWKNLVNNLIEDIREIDPSFEIIQIKEKFGALRFYVNCNGKREQEVYQLIRKAEALSAITCEWCGAPGESTTEGWIKTLCSRCSEERRIEGRRY